MKILTIRSDKPEAEIALFEDNEELASHTWQAHRQLAESINKQIAELLKVQKLQPKNIEGIVAYKGPGSFTGLRIGLSVTNALAYGLGVPILGMNGVDWKEEGINKLLAGNNERQVLPEYGSPAHITTPKK